MSYASIQAIREGAGLLSRVNNEKPKGTVDGSNRAFVVARRPIVDTDYDDDVTVADVRAYVNGSLVTVESLEPTGGQITLAVAPAAGTIVTIDYSYSAITDDYTAGKQQEADSWIDLKLKGYIATPLSPVPGIISTVAEMYAAGLILTRDWGSRVDSELTSKDGFNKIKQARDLIADYIAGLKADNTTIKDVNGSNNSVSATSDADVFSRTENELDGCDDPTERFMRRR